MLMADTCSIDGEVIGMVAFKSLTTMESSTLVKVFTTQEIRVDSPRRSVK